VPVLRTPDERFAGLPDFPYPPPYADAGGLRMAYVAAGPPDGEPVLLLHGEPSWSFLYRTVIGVLAEAGLRAIAADLVGFGRSDKPTEVSDHTYAQHVEWVGSFAFDQSGCQTKLPASVMAAYDAPFPDETYMAGVRAMPLLVPTAPDDPATAANQAAWQRLREWDKPFLVAFSDRDPITGGMAPVLKRAVPGAVGIDHPVLEGAGHFLQEDAGERLGTVIADFVRGNPAFP
jgi:pimeloyl-ACP methyl ester carboxylesterase